VDQCPELELAQGPAAGSAALPQLRELAQGPGRESPAPAAMAGALDKVLFMK